MHDKSFMEEVSHTNTHTHIYILHVARIMSYDAETKIAAIDKWITSGFTYTCAYTHIHIHTLQVARIMSYDAETKIAVIDKWAYDKSFVEQVLDQEDDDVPVKPPNHKSKYKIMICLPTDKVRMHVHVHIRT
jgi:hypothetical protein